MYDPKLLCTFYLFENYPSVFMDWIFLCFNVLCPCSYAHEEMDDHPARLGVTCLCSTLKSLNRCSILDWYYYYKLVRTLIPQGTGLAPIQFTGRKFLAPGIESALYFVVWVNSSTLRYRVALCVGHIYELYLFIYLFIYLNGS